MTPERQQRWDLRYIGVARFVASWSKDPSTQVGAVLVRPNNSIASTGFNGFPPGHPDSPELYADRVYKYKHIIHGEVNALNFAATQDHRGSTLYTSFPACPCCTSLCAAAGIIRIVCAPLPVSGRPEEWIAQWRAWQAESHRIARKHDVLLEEFHVRTDDVGRDPTVVVRPPPGPD